MKRLVEFSVDEGGSVLVEVADSLEGPVTRGVGSGRSAVVGKADKTVEGATAAVTPAARSVIARLRSVEGAPDEVAIGFGVQRSAQSGALMAAVAAEANVTVPLTWCRRGDTGG